MANEPHLWAAKLTREQQRALKQRDKDFQAALKAAARRRGWRYAGGKIFRQDGEWFASAMPFPPAWQGVVAQFMLKPMALDPLFWDIVGLSENSRLPLSFRANGAWVLRPPSIEACVGSECTEIVEPAELVVQFADENLDRSRKDRSIERMLAGLAEREPIGSSLALEISLQILAGDLNAALALCRSVADLDHVAQTGGFSTLNPDGSFSTFVDQAEAWIIARRRSSMRVV